MGADFFRHHLAGAPGLHLALNHFRSLGDDAVGFGEGALGLRQFPGSGVPGLLRPVRFFLCRKVVRIFQLLFQVGLLILGFGDLPLNDIGVRALLIQLRGEFADLLIQCVDPPLHAIHTKVLHGTLCGFVSLLGSLYRGGLFIDRSFLRRAGGLGGGHIFLGLGDFFGRKGQLRQIGKLHIGDLPRLELLLRLVQGRFFL